MSKIEPIPTLKPLFSTLNEIHLGYFLASTAFERLCVKLKIENIWTEIYKKVCNTRTYFSTSFDHKPFDCFDTLIVILNHLFQKDRSQCFNLLYNAIKEYQNWPDKEYNLNFNSLKQDLELIGVDSNSILEFIKLEKTNIIMPKNINDEWDNTKINNLLHEVRTSITSKRFNDTITYSYTILEGVFKLHLQKMRIDFESKADLNKLAQTVKRNLKEQFPNNSIVKYDHTLNLITTLTTAISLCRNQSSSSHFHNDADEQLANYCYGCTMIIVNYLSKLELTRE